MKTKNKFMALAALVTTLLAVSTPPVAAFTYQGALSQNGSPAQGPHEMTFQLLLRGTLTPVGSPITLPVEVSNGLFAVDLAFDPALFNGTEYDLQISVRVGTGPIFVLSPPSQITPSPQALFADSVGSVPDAALSGNVPRLNQPAGFLTNVSMPLLRVSDASGSGSLRFGPTDDCSLGIDPPGGLNGLLLRDPRGVRILSPDPLFPPVLRFGPTDDCSLGIDPPGGLSGIIERDPTGFRLMGQGGQGQRLIFGPTMLCTIEIQAPGPSSVPGLLLRDPAGVRILPPSSTQVPRLLFGPTDDCSIGVNPNEPIGIILRDPQGIRVTNPVAGGEISLGFGNNPDNICRISVNPSGPGGLLLRDPGGIRVLPATSTAIPRLIFGPTDDCSLSVDPTGTVGGLRVSDPVGLRVSNPVPGSPSRLIFGGDPDNLCMISVDPDPTAPVQGLQFSEPKGIRLTNPVAGGEISLGFGNNPDNLCRISVDPSGPAGLLLRDPGGIRLLPTASTAIPRLIFGPTDDCSISVVSAGQGLPPRMTFRDIHPFLFTNNMTVQGSVGATSFVNTSTRRLKENIQPIKNPIELIEQLQGVRYDWKAEQGGKADIGFIAEEVGKVIPEIVTWEEDGINARGLDYGHLVAVTVEGIKAQQVEIEKLRQEKADMEVRLARLEALLLDNTQPEEK